MCHYTMVSIGLCMHVVTCAEMVLKPSSFLQALFMPYRKKAMLLCQWYNHFCALSKIRGATEAGESMDIHVQLEKLREVKERLSHYEEELDQQCCKIRQCIKNIADDPASNQYPFHCSSFAMSAL